jgi:selenide,water dikinase
MVETVDVITPIIDDPYTFGAICAANSVSDIYAMGGRPLTALAILGYDPCEFEHAVIRDLLRGAIEKLNEANTCLVGGHSIEDKEFKFGFAVSGVVQKDALLKLSNARPGDRLILTKKIGTGILTSAVKLGKLKPSALKPVIDSMLTLNKKASDAAVKAGAHAATDVTGFGLLGHALNMAKASGVDIRIRYQDVPFMSGVREMLSSGIVQKGAKNTLKFVSPHVRFPENMGEVEKMSLVDPQTSGGLLISISNKGLKDFSRIMKRAKQPFWIIGEIVKGRGEIIVYG